VRHGPEKSFISFLAARMERWNLGVAQSKNIWHANGSWEDDTKGAASRLSQIVGYISSKTGRIWTKLGRGMGNGERVIL